MIISPRTSRYVDGRNVKTIIVYGHSPDAPTFDRAKGLPPLALIGVPDDTQLHQCGTEMELSCGLIQHAGAEAVVSFACDECDGDFLMLQTRHPDLVEYMK